jgi:hypothetical protein
MLGHGEGGKQRVVDRPTRVEIAAVEKVAIGQGHMAAVTRDGDLYVWGENAHGAFGGPPVKRSGEQREAKKEKKEKNGKKEKKEKTGKPGERVVDMSYLPANICNPIPGCNMPTRTRVFRVSVLGLGLGEGIGRCHVGCVWGFLGVASWSSVEMTIFLTTW